MSVAHGAHPGGNARPCERVQLTSSPIRSSVVLVTAVGEIDAANALELGTYAESGLENTSRLVVDLRGLEFFGTQGFRSFTGST